MTVCDPKFLNAAAQQHPKAALMFITGIAQLAECAWEDHKIAMEVDNPDDSPFTGDAYWDHGEKTTLDDVLENILDAAHVYLRHTKFYEGTYIECKSRMDALNHQRNLKRLQK